MSKLAFLQALIFTVIVFSLGMIIGFFLEIRQSDSIYSELVSSELNILDEQLRQKIITESNISCDLAKESLFFFADKIYDEAIYLEDVDNTGKIKDLSILHKRYDLLRTLLLVEAEDLKHKCKEDFHIINYLYSYNVEDVEINSKQTYFSRQVFDLKNLHPDEIVLIPIAINTNVSSVDLFVKSLDLPDYPVIIIDGDKFVTDFLTLEELENLTFSKSETNTTSP